MIRSLTVLIVADDFIVYHNHQSINRNEAIQVVYFSHLHDACPSTFITPSVVHFTWLPQNIIIGTSTFY